MATRSIGFDIFARDHASSVFDRVGASASAVERKFGKTGAGLVKAGNLAGKALLGMGAAGAVVGVKLVQAGERASTSNARILQVADSMGTFGDSAGDVTDRLVKLAEKQALATGVDQNAIKATQAKLLTFKELAESADSAGGAFDRATTAAVDMAAAGFGTAETNAVQLGKALNDPVKGITALTRSGITFSDKQRDVIKSLVESGKAGKAQAIVLKAIETQVGGTAEATANGSDIMRVRFSLLAEKLGQKLLPAFDKLVKVTTQVVDWVDKHQKAAAILIGTVVGLTAAVWAVGVAVRVAAAASTLASAATGVYAAVTGVASSTLGTFVGVKALEASAWVKSTVATAASTVATVAHTTVSIAASAASKAWTAAQWLLNAALTANPIGLVVVGIAALVAAFVIAYKKSETFRTIVNAAFASVKAVAAAVASFFTKQVPAAFQKVVGAAKSVLGWVKANWPKILAVLAGPVGVAALLIIQHWGKIKAGATAMFNGVKDVLGRMVTFVRGVPGKILGALGAVGTLLYAKGAAVVQGLINGAGSLMQALKDKVGGIPGAIVGALGSLGSLLYNAGASLVQGLINGITSKLAAIGEAMGKVASKVKGYFPGSPVKDGPLRSWNNGAAGRTLMEHVASGIKGDPVGTAMDRALTGVAARPTVGDAPQRVAGGGGVTVVANFYGLVGDPRAVVKQLQKAVRDAGVSGVVFTT